MLNLQEATLPELETESRRLSEAIHALHDERRPIDDEISARHDVIRSLKAGTPAEIDAAILATRKPAAASTEVTNGQ